MDWFILLGLVVLLPLLALFYLVGCESGVLPPYRIFDEEAPYGFPRCTIDLANHEELRPQDVSTRLVVFDVVFLKDNVGDPDPDYLLLFEFVSDWPTVEVVSPRPLNGHDPETGFGTRFQFEAFVPRMPYSEVKVTFYRHDREDIFYPYNQTSQEASDDPEHGLPYEPSPEEEIAHPRYLTMDMTADGEYQIEFFLEQGLWE